MAEVRTPKRNFIIQPGESSLFTTIIRNGDYERFLIEEFRAEGRNVGMKIEILYQHPSHGGNIISGVNLPFRYLNENEAHAIVRTFPSRDRLNRLAIEQSLPVDQNAFNHVTFTNNGKKRWFWYDDPAIVVSYGSWLTDENNSVIRENFRNVLSEDLADRIVDQIQELYELNREQRVTYVRLISTDTFQNEFCAILSSDLHSHFGNVGAQAGKESGETAGFFAGLITTTGLIFTEMLTFSPIGIGLVTAAGVASGYLLGGIAGKKMGRVVGERCSNETKATRKGKIVGTSVGAIVGALSAGSIFCFFLLQSYYLLVCKPTS